MEAVLLDVMQCADGVGVVLASWRGETVVWTCYELAALREACYAKGSLGDWQFDVGEAGVTGGSYFRGDEPETRSEALGHAKREFKSRVKMRGGSYFRWHVGIGGLIVKGA